MPSSWAAEATPDVEVVREAGYDRIKPLDQPGQIIRLVRSPAFSLERADRTPVIAKVGPGHVKAGFMKQLRNQGTDLAEAQGQKET
jgi:hypothetical protein